MEYAIGKRLDNKSIKFPISYKYKEVYCPYNSLISLDIPKGVKIIKCFVNRINKLILSDSIEEVQCYDNQITELILYDKLQRINCSHNNITRLILPLKSIYGFSCYHNPVSQQTFLSISTEMHNIYRQEELENKDYYCWEMFERAVINIANKIPAKDLKNLQLSDETRQKIKGIEAIKNLGII